MVKVIKINNFVGFMKPVKGVRITKVSGNWVDGILNGKYFFQAKIFGNPSRFGIYKGRISKLAICNSRVWNSDKVIYAYDRGGDKSTKQGLRLRGKLLEAFYRKTP